MLPTKILLFSADLATVHAIATSLIEVGYKVVHSARGMGAMDFIHAEKPALIILDRELPDYNSLSIIRSIRSDEQNGRIPVVLIGSNLREEDVLIGLEVGADLCLLETFHPQVFTARIRSLLRRTEPIKLY